MSCETAVLLYDTFPDLQVFNVYLPSAFKCMVRFHPYHPESTSKQGSLHTSSCNPKAMLALPIQTSRSWQRLSCVLRKS